VVFSAIRALSVVFAIALRGSRVGRKKQQIDVTAAWNSAHKREAAGDLRIYAARSAIFIGSHFAEKTYPADLMFELGLGRAGLFDLLPQAAHVMSTLRPWSPRL